MTMGVDDTDLRDGLVVTNRADGTASPAGVVGAQLQSEGAGSFVDSWDDLLRCIDSKTATLAKTG